MQKGFPKQFRSQNHEYTIMKFIGQGSGGEVYLANQKNLQNDSVTQVAIKRKIVHVNDDEQKLTIELIQNRAKYPNIVQYFDFFELKPYGQILVMEYMKSGNLYDYICDISNKKKDNFVKEAQQIIYQVCLGIQQLHSQGLMHRDLKPENLLIQLKSDNTYIIKICDMDLVKKVKQENLFNTHCVGTAYYIAPEVLMEQNNDGSPFVTQNYQVQYDLKCDIWALGAMIYEIFSGQTLFQGNEQEIQDSILNFEQNCQMHYKKIDNLNFKGLDQEYKNVIKKMLTFNYKERPSIDDVLKKIANYGQDHLINSINEEKYMSQRIVNNGQVYFCLDSQQTTKNGINECRVYLGRKDDHQQGQQILIYVYSKLDDKGIIQLQKLLDVKNKLKYIMPINDVFQYEGDWVIVQYIDHVEELETMDQVQFHGVAKYEQIRNLIACLQELQYYELVVGDFKLSYMVKYSSDKFKLDVLKSDYFLKEKIASKNDRRFQSPESECSQKNNSSSLKSDIWTMGVLIYEIVSENQFDNSNLKQQQPIDEQINKVDMEYREYLLKMLKVNQEERSVPVTQVKSLHTTTGNINSQSKSQFNKSEQQQQPLSKEDKDIAEIDKILKTYDNQHKLLILLIDSFN